MNNELLAIQSACSNKLGFDHLQIDQGTNAWLRLRMGVVTASKAHYLLMGRKTAGRIGYMNELIAQIATGKLVEEIKAKPLAWGKEHEAEARDAYSTLLFEPIDEYSFIYQNENMRTGISPDGIIPGINKGLELKCPWSSAIWCAFAGQGTIKKEEVAQVQFSLMVTGFKTWAFAKYDPRNVNCKKLHHVLIDRDEDVISKMRVGLSEFIADMDAALKVLGLTFGDQWKCVK